jgi:hypothetical protein
MILGDRDIRTPFIREGDDPLNVACDWPHQVAVAMHDLDMKYRNLPKVLKNSPECKLFCTHAEFLTSYASSAVAARKKYWMHHVVDSWAVRRDESQGRDYLDPMLLGGAPYGIIADLCGEELLGEKSPWELIAMYEKLYYHCRKSDGVTVASPIRKRILALNGAATLAPRATEQDKWKAVASIFTYPVLVEQWGFWDVDTQDGLSDDTRFKRQQRYGQAHMFARMAAGQVDDEQSLALVSQGMDHEKQQFEMGAGTSENAWAQLTGRVLMLAAPKLAPIPHSKEQLAAQQTALENKLAAQRNVSTIDVEDAGPAAGRDARNQQIQDHLATEAARQESPTQ